MKNLLLIIITTVLLFPTQSQSITNHFSAGGVLELDLSDSEISLKPKQERDSQAQKEHVHEL